MATVQEKAKIVREAVKGLGTDDEALIDLFCKMPYADRIALPKAYYDQFKRDIIADIKEDTSGHYKEILVNLLRPKATLVAEFVRKAVKGLTTNEEMLTHVLTQFPEHIEEARATYAAMYESDMYEDVRKATHGHYKKLLCTLVEHNIDRDSHPDLEAEFLYKAGAGRLGTDEMTFINILGKRTKSDIRKIEEAYNEEHPELTLVDAIKKEMSFKLKDALVAIVTPRPDYFARVLQDAVKGMGTKDSTIVMAFSLLDESEIKKVSRSYYVIYRKSLLDDLRSDTSGNYRELLIALIN